HSWRSTAIVIASLAVLVAGAAAAAYAAWGKRSHAPRAAHNLSAAAPASAPLAGNGGAGALPGTATPPGRALGLGGLAKPPKIPLKALTPRATPLLPKATAPVSTPALPPTHTTTTTPTTTGGSTASGLPPALELDTNAAATYDPYSYPTSNFGDPSLAIDGDTTTGWTAQVEPTAAPKMAEGVAVDRRPARTGAGGRAPGTASRPADAARPHGAVRRPSTSQPSMSASCGRRACLWRRVCCAVSSPGPPRSRRGSSRSRPSGARV